MNSQKKQKTINLLTMCIKAGKIVKGNDSVCGEVGNGKAFCVMTAEDISEKTLKEISFICEKHKVPVLKTELTKEDMGHYTGKQTAVIAVCDKGFAGGFMKIYG